VIRRVTVVEELVHDIEGAVKSVCFGCGARREKEEKRRRGKRAKGEGREDEAEVDPSLSSDPLEALIACGLKEVRRAMKIEGIEDEEVMGR